MKTNMTNTLLKLTTLTTLTLALTACGGGGGGSTGTVPTDTTPNETINPPSPTTNTLAACSSTNQGFDTATDVTNKTLHKLTTDAEVRVWDLSDGSKVACASAGSVEVL
ncbi:MAG: hypothetical protein ABFQ64_11315 [Campylobacterota bacterium]